jgi:hypothetical protein
LNDNRADGEKAERHRGAREEPEEMRREPREGRRRGLPRDAGHAREHERIARELDDDARSAPTGQHAHRSDIDDGDEHPDEQADRGEGGLAADRAGDRQRDVGIETESALEARRERRMRQAEQMAARR